MPLTWATEAHPCQSWTWRSTAEIEGVDRQIKSTSMAALNNEIPPSAKMRLGLIAPRASCTLELDL